MKPLPSQSTLTLNALVDSEMEQGVTTHDHLIPLEKDELEDENYDELQNSKAAMKKLQLACLCSFVFMCVQIAGGYYAHSLAIMTDAAHLMSDVAGFLVSLFAMYLGQFPASATMPFGYHRAEVIGALLSVLLIWVLASGLMFTAVRRLFDQENADANEKVDGKAMFLVAVFGLGINLVLMKILGHGHSHGHCHDDEKSVAERSPGHNVVQTPMSAMALIDCVEEPLADGLESLAPKSSVVENINVHAAYIHALGDFLQSLGVCFAGGLIWYNPSWQMADPITTLLFSFLVLGTTIGVLTRTVHILMEGAPPALDLRVVEKQIRALECVYDVHDLHIWMLTDGHYAASVHILSNGEARMALKGTQRVLASLGVRQQTVQVEDPADRDWNEDMFCNWTTYLNVALEAESKMSVPRAGTKKAALAPLPGTTID